MSYDEESLCALIDKWAQDALRTKHTETKNVVPQMREAELAYEVAWSAGSSLNTDVTALSKSLQQTLGPVARLSSCNMNSRTMIISILPMPNKALKRIESEVQRFTKMLDQWSLKTYVILFCAAVALFLYFSVELHNHWFGYEEPWETPLEFIWYHTPFFNHKHE